MRQDFRCSPNSCLNNVALEEGGWTRYSPGADLPPPLSLKQPPPTSQAWFLLHIKKQPWEAMAPTRSKKHVHIPIKHSKRRLFLGCLSQPRVPAARFPELLSLPLAVGKIKLIEKRE